MRGSGVAMKKQVAYLQKLFYDLWNDFGSVYLVVGHSDRTRIGRRGFTDEEKKHGLVLAFNNRTNEKMEWDDEGNVSCVLAFGARREDVFIHHDDLRGVFSPEAGVQFLRGDADREPASSTESDTLPAGDKQVVSLSNFKKRKSTERP
jgi:hypothetical protein